MVKQARRKKKKWVVHFVLVLVVCTITFKKLSHLNEAVIQSIKLGRREKTCREFFSCILVFLITPLSFTSRSRPHNPIKRFPNRCSSR